MKRKGYVYFAFLLALGLFLSQCNKEEFYEQTPEMILKKGGKPGGESAGNNLSYPVIWAEGFAKTLPGTLGMNPFLNGEWWYSWGSNGTDPNIVPASCPPDPDAIDSVLNPDGLDLCDDGIHGSVDLNLVAGYPIADNPLPLAKAFVQKDPNNVWQAGVLNWPSEIGGELDVDWIDWGDNLESVDWYTRSQVRTEIVLFQDLDETLLEYEMRHTSGWGIDEVHGLAADLVDVPLAAAGTKATVYSHCARLTIQKLLVERDDERLASLNWVPGEGWTEPVGSPYELVNDHIFNGSVHEGGDGPGYYSAEINVKGRIIYGYTWNVRNLHDETPVGDSNIPTPAGDYRITFSFDEVCGTVTLNTHFTGITKIIVPLEEELITAALDSEGEDSGGGTPVLDISHNLTYIDVRILERDGGGGGGKKGGRR